MIPAIQRRVVILAHRRRGYEIEALVREHRAIGLLVEHNNASQGSIVVPFDRGTLASHIGTTRENLSRSLSLLTEHGVRIRGREIVIDSKELLEIFARPQPLIDDPSS